MVTQRKVTHWIHLYEAQVGGSAELNEENNERAMNIIMYTQKTQYL